MFRILYHDGTSYFVIPNQADPGDTIRLKLRAQKGTTVRAEVRINGTVYEMARLQAPQPQADGEPGPDKGPTKGCADAGMSGACADFDWYVYDHLLGEEKLEYSFCAQLHSGEHATLGEEHPFRFVPGFYVPKWCTGAVMYQIYVDRFCNGNPANDVTEGEYEYLKHPVHAVSDWETLPDPNLDVGNFYGGDLQGVMHKLDYLEWLGVEVIYFNPLFLSPSNHKYDTMDYDVIDPHFGMIERNDSYGKRVLDRHNQEATNAYFAEFVEQAHKHGIRVILDGVFNHCGSFHRWMNREKLYGGNDGAYEDPDSSWREFFRFEKEDWPDNEAYECWWDNLTLPKLNYEGSEALCEEILRIGRKWVSAPYHADGWRLDVAADLGHSPEFNHAFWKRFRKVVKEANPEAVVLAENYGSSADWLCGDEWDTIMNYSAFMEPVSFFFTGMEKHSDYRDDKRDGDGIRFLEEMESAQREFLTPSLYAAMNELSNHDHSRFLTRTNRKAGRASELGSAAASEGVDKDIFMEAVVLQMTWPGAPSVYYGDEAGVCGFTDPDNRRTYPWGKEDRMLLEFHHDMIAIHKAHPALIGGSHIMLEAGRDLLAYGRFDDTEQLIVILNHGRTERKVRLPVWWAQTGQCGQMEMLIRTGNGGYTTETEVYEIRDGMLEMTAMPVSGMVLKAVAP